MVTIHTPVDLFWGSPFKSACTFPHFSHTVTKDKGLLMHQLHLVNYINYIENLYQLIYNSFKFYIDKGKISDNVKSFSIEYEAFLRPL